MSWLQNVHDVADMYTMEIIRLAKDNDICVELLLDASGKIAKPYIRDTAFRVIAVERWQSPDCMPGVITTIYTEVSPHICLAITVLCGNNQYIILSPRISEITDQDKHGTDIIKQVRERLATREFQFLADKHDMFKGQYSSAATSFSTNPVISGIGTFATAMQTTNGALSAFSSCVINHGSSPPKSGLRRLLTCRNNSVRT